MALFVLVCLAGITYATPDIFLLETGGGSVQDIWLEDVQQDRLLDIVALWTENKEKPATFIAVFSPSRPRLFENKPTTLLKLEETTTGLFFAENNGVPPRELVVLNSAGATVYRFETETNAFAEEARYEFNTLFPTGLCPPHFFTKVAFDLNRDKVEEWLLPDPSGVVILRQGAVIGRIHSETRGKLSPDSFGNNLLSYQIPQFFIAQGETQPNSGIVFINGGTIELASGPLWENRSTFPLPFHRAETRKMAAGEKTNGKQQAWAFPSPPRQAPFALLHDLNGDQVPDLLVVESVGSLNATTTVKVHHLCPSGTLSETPEWQVEKAGFVQPLIEDVDRDGFPDIVLLQLQFGTRFVLNYLTSSKATFGCDVFLNKNGTFASKPDLSSSLLVKTPDTCEEGIFVLGDFDGDKRLDCAFGGSDGKIVVHTGQKGRFVSATPWLTVESAGVGSAVARDLDGNGRDDLVIFRKADAGHPACEIVLF